MKINGKIIERPQHLFMRVAVGIHGIDLKDAIETYEYMSKKYFTHATPTLFNAATKRPQLSSCFLLAMKEDSIDGIIAEGTATTQLPNGTWVGSLIEFEQNKGYYKTKYIKQYYHTIKN